MAIPVLRGLLIFATVIWLAACGVAPETTQAESPFKVQVYTPGEQSIFAVSSTLIQGDREAILVDAQFATADAWKLATSIRASGKTLTTIYISRADPEYYFGLDPLKTQFPDVRIVATPQTVQRIQTTWERKLAAWRPLLEENTPKAIIVPEPLEQRFLTLEGRELPIIGAGPDSTGPTFVWIPEIKTVIAGGSVTAGEHLWLAEAATEDDRRQWLAVLERIETLQPSRVVPGHIAAGATEDMSAVHFTADYIRGFNRSVAEADNAEDVIDSMLTLYPDLDAYAALEISAKIAMGELQLGQ